VVERHGGPRPPARRRPPLGAVGRAVRGRTPHGPPRHASCNDLILSAGP
jgi:hypothetical protein